MVKSSRSLFNLAQPRTWFLVVWIGMVLAGCSKEPAARQVSLSAPLVDMRTAVQAGNWERADLYLEAVIARYETNADALALAAQVAYARGRTDQSADLLVKACRAESFASEPRLQQTMIALVERGRLFDGMELLEHALAAHPEQLETMRWLFDFYVGTEDRTRALPLGQTLVLRRKFDVVLLMALSHTERRTLDFKPLQDMVSKNPTDLRPLIGEARASLDRSEFAKARELAQRIVTSHAEFTPAQIVLGRALVGEDKTSELVQWLNQLPQSATQDAGFWLILGDWSRLTDQYDAAARCFWEATRRDPDLMEAWSKFASAWRRLPTASESNQAFAAAIDKRLSLLSGFSQTKNRFERTGSISRALASEMIGQLDSLGRLWEAEAWAAVALTLPADESVQIDAQRQSIVKRLGKSVPWQITAEHAELTTDLSHLPLPDFLLESKLGTESLTPNDPSKPNQPANDTAPSAAIFSFAGEAQQRGIDFFGRTGDHLDQPGIMLHQTLGCGGGAIDFDLDGWPDIYLLDAGGSPAKQDSRPNQLYRNQNGRFVNVTTTAQTGDQGFAQGLAVGDANDDGFADILVLNYGPNCLYINNGDGTFSEATERMRASLPEQEQTNWSTCGVFADLDLDGLNDMVVVNYCAGLEPSTVPCPMDATGVSRSCTPMKFAARTDQFFKGLPRGEFVEVTSQWNAIPQTPGRGLGIVAGNLDGLPGNEVYIANDMTNNHYWMRPTNTAEFTLMEAATPRGLAADDRMIAQGSMGIACSDFDRDQDLDFYVTNFDGEYNTLYEQIQPGVWQDTTNRQGLAQPTMPFVGFGTLAIDVDNDGWEELLVTNGHVDLFSREDESVLYAQLPQLFRRLNAGTYQDVAKDIAGDYFQSTHVGRAAWMFDADVDGRRDVMITHQTEAVTLLMNRAEQGVWVELTLVGTDCNRDAVGAEIILEYNDQRRFAVKTVGDGYFSVNDMVHHFGLDGKPNAVNVTIRWPDGTQSRYTDLITNSRHLCVQNEDAWNMLSPTQKPSF